ncbi:MAG: diguanylate cyclase [Thermodesulfobacteriota bacterium]
MKKPTSLPKGEPPPPPKDPHDSAALAAYSHEVARRVLPLLAENGIPVTPNNYRLWYEYYAGGSEVLKRTLDRLMEDGIEFTPEVTRALYQRFFSLEATEQLSKLVDRAGEKVQVLATEFVKELLVSVAETSEYSQTLGAHIEKIESTPELVSVRDIIASMMDETGQVLRSQDNLQRRMEKTSQELTELQEELRKSEQQAHTDELTGLHNRRAFNVRLAEETGRSRRYNNALSLIILDLDDFKPVNDAFGHLVGDRLLVTLAQTLEKAVRGPDFACRYGGEEFAIICPHTDLPGATMLAERLRKTIASTTFTVKGKSIPVTISAGVALLRPHQNMEQLIDRADKAMYLAKSRGKNQVRTEEELAA